MIEVISITLVIIGALIGAGFASGQEIFSFFYIYGKNGIYGILIMSILIGIFIYKSLKIIYQKQVYNYNDFLNLFIKNTKIRNVILWIVNVLLLVSFYIMVAGFGAYLEQEINLNNFMEFSRRLLASLCATFENSASSSVLSLNFIVLITVSKVLLAILSSFFLKAFIFSPPSEHDVKKSISTKNRKHIFFIFITSLSKLENG